MEPASSSLTGLLGELGILPAVVKLQQTLAAYLPQILSCCAVSPGGQQPEIASLQVPVTNSKWQLVAVWLCRSAGTRPDRWEILAKGEEIRPSLWFRLPHLDETSQWEMCEPSKVLCCQEKARQEKLFFLLHVSVQSQYPFPLKGKAPKRTVTIDWLLKEKQPLSLYF